jgi:Uma2 family endonuclease
MSPSPKKSQNRFSGKFYRLIGNILDNPNFKCDCEVFYEIDWVIDESNVVRPDVMVVCGNSNEEIQIFPPTIILETASPSTVIKDRNTKFTLYEMCGVKYYIMADPQKNL